MSDQPDPAAKLHVDSDWKAEAEAEKQRLAEETADMEGGAGPGQIPPADFQMLISSMATQALMSLGGMPDPATGQRMVHLELGRHQVDLLGVLEEKTKGNLEEQEQKMLTQTVHELRMHYLNVAKQVAAQMGGAGAGGAEPGDEKSAGGGPASPIITG